MCNSMENLKKCINIADVAVSLGFQNNSNGSNYLQGDCPKHGSQNGRCLTIWPATQSFKCFHCGEGGDVISLVQLYKGCDFREAVDYLAERAGVESPLHAGLSDEEREQRQSVYKEKQLVFGMLTEAVSWCHQQLKSGEYPIIGKLLTGHYGFSVDIIDSLQIGFLPPSNDGQETSLLAKHLENIPEFKGQVVKTGLFSFTSPEGPYYDFMPGRVIFPYWYSGQVRYLIGRKTEMTPENKYGQAKYKKLRTYVADNDNRQHISPFIQNEIFMGEGLVQSGKSVIITEGAPDWVSARDYLPEIPAISPVTIQFRDRDIEKLVAMTRDAGPVYIINDNEENQAGHNGAVKTAEPLLQAGTQVYVVQLPKPDNAEKIDLNEYLLDHTADDLRQLMNETPSFLDVMIESLPADFPRAQATIVEKIAPVLAVMDEALVLHYIDVIRKRVGTTTKVVKELIDQVKNTKAVPVEEQEEKEVDPEVQKMAEEIAADPFAFKKRIDIINQAGIVGERNVIAMNYVALDSRLLLDGDVIALKNSGHKGSGKSTSLSKCLKFYDPNGYELLTNGSQKFLYHMEEDALMHKALIFAEGFAFERKNAQDSEMVYVIRTLISEGKASYTFTEKQEDGSLKAVTSTLYGPVSFITTTIMDNLESQLEDRMFSVHPDESSEQTRRIMMMTSMVQAGLAGTVDELNMEAWRVFHGNLEPVKVVIPFAVDIVKVMTSKPDDYPIAARRAISRVFSVIKAIAAFHQGLRNVDEQGRLIAEMADYWMALQIVQQAYAESMGGNNQNHALRMAYIKENGPVQYRELEPVWNVSKPAISSFVKAKVREGVLAWCDEDGNEFANNQDLGRAKRSGHAYVCVTDNYQYDQGATLPDPWVLTDAPGWQRGGELLSQYDLHIKDYTDSAESISEPSDSVTDAPRNEMLFDENNITGERLFS